MGTKMAETRARQLNNGGFTKNPNCKDANMKVSRRRKPLSTKKEKTESFVAYLQGVIDFDPKAKALLEAEMNKKATEATEGDGTGFLLTARKAGSYVHVSGTGWAPADTDTLAKGLCPSLAALVALPFPPEE